MGVVNWDEDDDSVTLDRGKWSILHTEYANRERERRIGILCE